MRRSLLWLIVAALCLCTVLLARRHRKPGTQDRAQFDYYLLSLSWAPNYCADHPQDRSAECKPGNRTAFVLHGLWPSSNDDPMQPLSCGTAPPVASDIVRHMLEYFPDKGLIQHEWQKHGTCSGLTAAQYFGQVEQAYKSVQPPESYKTLNHEETVSVRQIEQDFSATNHAPESAFRVSCHASELVGVEACLDKDLKFQACPRTTRECRSQQVSLAAPK
jgi:ribonuclease T2